MSTIEARHTKTKAGQPMLLRSAQLRDAQALVDFMRVIFTDGEGMSRQIEEYTTTPEEQQETIAEATRHPDKILVIAEVDGQLAGMIDFKPGERKRHAHTGVFGISVAPGWRSQGVGKPLLEALLDWARANPRIEKVCLAVMANNDRAIQLYRKLGFVEEGHILRHSKLGEGRYVDDLLMAQFV